MNKYLNIFHVILLILFCFTAGCSKNIEEHKFYEKYQQIRVGMSTSEVNAILGHPNVIKKQEDELDMETDFLIGVYEIWVYNDFYDVEVEFTKDRKVKYVITAGPEVIVGNKEDMHKQPN